MTAQEYKTAATEILNQLGGRRFVAMTGSKNFVNMDATGIGGLRMDLTPNQSRANRLLITLLENDTYEMYFYRQEIKTKGGFEVKITDIYKEQGIYCDMLQTVFTQVTGMHTKL